MNNELSKTKIDEKTGIEYHLEGDYYIPNLTMPKQEKITLNKYGRMRLNYLKEHKKADYSIMLLDGTLNTHLKEIQEQAISRVEQIIKTGCSLEGAINNIVLNSLLDNIILLCFWAEKHLQFKI